MKTLRLESTITMQPLSFIREQHLVRRIHEQRVARLISNIERIGVKSFPLAVTPDGVLFGGNHRYEAFKRLGIDHCLMDIYTPESIDRDAIELNDAEGDVLHMTFVDYAEMVWRKVGSGQTQQAVADEMGWTREKVAQFYQLQKICPEAWFVVVTTFQSGVTNDDKDDVTNLVTSVTFTENLLRSIVQLTPPQQLELVRDLASGRIQKGKFKSLAQNYRCRNEAGDWIKQQLVDTTLVDRCLTEIAKGIYDAEWHQAQGPGPKLLQLVHTAREEWERQNSISLIHGDFYDKVKQIGNSSIDLILTDPPYNIASDSDIKIAGRSDMKRNFGEWDKYSHADFMALIDQWAIEFRRILTNNGSGYIFTSYQYLSHMTDALTRVGMKVMNTIVWHKANPGTQVVKTNFKNAVEYILFFTKGDADHTFNWQGENEMQNCVTLPICGGGERLANARGDTLHPTQKPLALLRHLLEISSHPGDMVFDGFMGVGSTAQAARDLGRKFIGIEQDQTFFEAAQRRLTHV
ncbi:MAG: ParB N-terminal domain-containing protein [Magnetococcales bacterium]|nr:ParB N-terminal domain-containing protein [Magnetococcales bacterium]